MSQHAPTGAVSPSPLGIGLAFTAVFLVWGSVYLAIQMAIETLPPLLMVGVRLVAAGAVLYAWMRWRGVDAPTRQHWVHASIVGALTLACGAGAVAWAQQRIPSGLTALIIATEPFWIVILDWLWHNGPRPNLGVAAGILLGFAGVGILAAPGGFLGDGGLDPVGVATILAATVCWAVGSLYSRHAPQPTSLLLAASMQMACGGSILILVGVAIGEWPLVDLSSVSLKSWLAFAYLWLFASLITFPAYIWLLQNVRAARVAVYAYVNPVVALLLGWLVAGETLSRAGLTAAGLILAAVVLVVTCAERPTRKHIGQTPPAAGD